MFEFLRRQTTAGQYPPSRFRIPEAKLQEVAQSKLVPVYWKVLPAAEPSLCST